MASTTQVWVPGQELTSSDVNTWIIPRRGLKTGPTSRSATSKSTDPDLSMPLLASSVYAFEFSILYSSVSINLAFNVFTPGGWTGNMSVLYTNAGAATVLEDHLLSDALTGFATVITSFPQAICIDGLVTTTGAGNLAFNWAASATTGSVTVQTGSTCMAWKVG